MRPLRPEMIYAISVDACHGEAERMRCFKADHARLRQSATLCLSSMPYWYRSSFQIFEPTSVLEILEDTNSHVDEGLARSQNMAGPANAVQRVHAVPQAQVPFQVPVTEEICMVSHASGSLFQSEPSYHRRMQDDWSPRASCLFPPLSCVSRDKAA